jgi:hypothetical protein
MKILIMSISLYIPKMFKVGGPGLTSEIQARLKIKPIEMNFFAASACKL